MYTKSMSGLGDSGAYGATSTAALAAAVASGQTLAAVVQTTPGAFTVLPLTSPSQYDAIKADADTGKYSYTGLYNAANSTTGLFDEYSTQVLVTSSVFESLKSPWVLGGIGVLLLVAVWSTRGTAKGKRKKRRGYPTYRRRTTTTWF